MRPRILCNFAGMKQNLPDYIRDNEHLRQILRAQKGGIMKYWAEHPDADGKEDLFKGYRGQCAYDYREEHKWEVMLEDVMKRDALAKDHIMNELVYLEDLKSVLSISFTEVAEQTICFIEDYLDYAFKEWRSNLYPNGIPPLTFYDQVISSYNLEFGVAGTCLWLVLKEHRGTAKAEKDGYDLWMEFEIRQFARIYFIGGEKLRQAIKEIIDKNTQGKTPDECRRICHKLAIDTMKKLKRFALRVNGDYDRVIFYKDKQKKYPVVWSADKLAEILNVDERRIRRDNVEITKEEMAWLRVDMNYCDTSHGATNCNGLTPLQDSFSRYYQVLMNIGHFWAAQLLRHGIDMQELEKEYHTILIHHYYRLGYWYYVDRLANDQRGDCCVYDAEEAKELLDKIRREGDDENTKRKAILEYVGRLKDIVKDEYATVYDEMWQEILKIESVKNKVYEKGKQQDTIFNRNLVANIIKLMNDKGIYKVGTNPTNMARLLDSERGENSPVREPLGASPAEKSLQKDVEDVIAEYHNKTKANK